MFYQNILFENLRDLTPPGNNKEDIKEQRTKINLSSYNLAVLFKSLSKNATSFINFVVSFGTLLKVLIAQSHNEDFSEKFCLYKTSVKTNLTIFFKKIRSSFYRTSLLVVVCFCFLFQ